MKMHQKHAKAGLLTSAAAIALTTYAAGGAITPALAQEDAEPIRTADVIVVTTERREQSIQDVAATVQAFTQEELLRLGVNDDFSNLQYTVPGLQVADQEGKIEIFLRGIGNQDSDFSSDPSIATHFNGVYLARPRGIGPLFFDAQRVEINKGPQGTLRGRNAVGGTVNIISNRPHFDGFEGYVMGGVGNFSSREFEGAANIPVTDTFAVRAAVWSKKHDGLYTNEFLADNPNPDFKTPSAQDDVAGRISALWEPNNDFSAYFLWQRSDTNSSGDPGTFASRMLSAGFDIDTIDDPWNQYFRTEGDFDQSLSTYLGVLSYDFGGIGVEYSGAYNSVDAYNQNASREWQLGMVYPGSEAEAAFIASGANPQRNLLVNDTFHQSDNSKSQIHELRFYGTDDGPLVWSAGGFYFRETFNWLSWDVGNGFCGNSDFFGFDAPLGPSTFSCWQNGLGGEDRNDDSTVESMAFYADGVYDVTDRLRVKGGIRWSQDEKTQNDYNVGEYRFDFNTDYLASQGITQGSQIIIGEEGFRLVGAGDRPLPVSAPAGVDQSQVFFDSIEAFGLGDNVNALVLGGCLDLGQCRILINSSSFDDPNTPDVIELSATNKVKQDYVDWRAGLEFDLSEDNLLYFTASTGTRSGGINRPLVLADGRPLNREWQPEELLAYELGSKNSFFFGDYNVVLNAAVFYYDYDQKTSQLLVDVPNPTPLNPNGTTQRVLTDNVSDASLFGIELEAQTELPMGFNAGMNLLYIDSEYENSEILDPRTSQNNVVNIDGNRLQNTSEWNINARLSQEIFVDRGYVNSVDWTLNLLYRSEFNLTPFGNTIQFDDGSGVLQEVNIANLPASGLLNFNGAVANCTGCGGPPNGNALSDVVDSFILLNLNAGVNLGEDDRFRIDFWAENLTDKAFSTKGFVNSSVNIRYLNAPRQYGVRLRAKF